MTTNTTFDLKSSEDFQLLHLRFPHIARKIEFLWGSQDFYIMFNELMHNTRDGERQGFPLEAGSALLRLHMKHAIMFPNPSPELWDNTYMPR